MSGDILLLLLSICGLGFIALALYSIASKVKDAPGSFPSHCLYRLKCFKNLIARLGMRLTRTEMKILFFDIEEETIMITITKT
jgi:hypothetical protein